MISAIFNSPDPPDAARFQCVRDVLRDVKTPDFGKKAKNYKVEKSMAHLRKFRKDRALRRFVSGPGT
jgi:hypothetical protein